MIYINTHIDDVDNINKISFVFGDSFEIFSRNTIQSRSKQIIAFVNGTLDFFIGKKLVLIGVHLKC